MSLQWSDLMLVLGFFGVFFLALVVLAAARGLGRLRDMRWMCMDMQVALNTIHARVQERSPSEKSARATAENVARPDGRGILTGAFRVEADAPRGAAGRGEAGT